MSFALSPSFPLNGGSEFTLDRFPAIVGRDPDCDIRLHDSWVSRLHCELNQVKGRLVILDLESRHGTFVNGTRVSFAHLVPGDCLLVGHTRLVVAPGGKVLRLVRPRAGTLISEFFTR